MHLLDTEVIWALRGQNRERPDDKLFEWVAEQIPSTLFVSVASIMEFENGTRMLERRDRTTGTAIRHWIDTRLRPAFEGRILAIDDGVARTAARLGYGDFRDGVLAATALQHGLVVATGSPKNFRVGKVKTIDPWAYAAEPDALDWRRASQSAPMWLKNLFVRA